VENYVDADFLNPPEPAVVAGSTPNVRCEPFRASRSVTSSAQEDSPV